MPRPREAALQSLLDQHRLPPDYLIAAQNWFDPAVDSIALHQKGANRPILVGVNGSQGSGNGDDTFRDWREVQDAHRDNDPMRQRPAPMLAEAPENPEADL